MKFFVGALAAVALFAGVAAAQPAEARCFWNGYTWHCWHPHYHGYWRSPYYHRGW
jgi:hypothetical protein